MNQQLQKTEYSKDRAMVDTVRATIFPGSSDAELALFFYQCNTTGVHPLSKLIIPIKYGQGSDAKISFISTIDLHRSKANDTGAYDGQDEPIFEGQIDQECKDADGNIQNLPVPELCKVAVYRKNVGRPFIGIARWKEYYPGQQKGHKWRQMPFLMLSKCAEALALRKGFPDELHNLYTEEEMQNTIEMLAGVSTRTSTKPTVNPDDVTEQPPPSGENAHVGVVGNVTFKEGKGKKGPWTKYTVQIDDKGYATFDKGIAEQAKALKGKRASYKTEKTGDFENLVSIEAFIDPAPSKPQDAPTATQGPSAMDADQFTAQILSMGLQVGMDEKKVLSVLDAEFSVKALKDVPADKQSQIIDYFQAAIDEIEAEATK
jgi:phage recombination protein Bet